MQAQASLLGGNAMEYNLLDIILVAVLVAISSGTLGVIFKAVYDRVCKKHDKQDEILRRLRKQAIDISQLKITTLINNSPKDHHAIISECEHYFLVLRADSWVWGAVEGWSKKEHVNITYLKAAHEENKSRKFQEKNIF